MGRNTIIAIVLMIGGLILISGLARFSIGVLSSLDLQRVGLICFFLGLYLLIYEQEWKKRAQLEHPTRLKSQSFNLQKAIRKFQCLLVRLLKKKLRLSNWLKKKIPLWSIDNCGEATDKERYQVAKFLKDCQKEEIVKKMDIGVSLILTLFLAFSIFVVFVFRVNQQDLLNTILANLVIPNAIASIILPFLYSASRYFDRLDFRIVVAKVAILYIVNLVTILISLSVFVYIDSLLLIMRRWLDSLLADLLTLFLLILIVYVWVILGYYLIMSIDLRYIDSFYSPSKRIKRFMIEEDEDELNEAGFFILTSTMYSDTGYLVLLFTLLNMMFVWSVIQGRIFIEIGDIFMPFPSSTIILLIVGVLILYVCHKIFWLFINGRNTQVQLVKEYDEWKKRQTT